MRPMKFGFGQPVRRVEDQRLTTGTGRYTDDIAAEGALHAFVLRSAMAHARFTLSGLDDARDMEGVALILTADDIEEVRTAVAGVRADLASATAKIEGQTEMVRTIRDHIMRGER